jgi:hypothetical protein
MCSVGAAGSPYAAFRRAIEARNLTRALIEARDLPQISLVDVAELVVLAAEQHRPSFERWAGRWSRASVSARVRLRESSVAGAERDEFRIKPLPWRCGLGVAWIPAVSALSLQNTMSAFPGAQTIDPRNHACLAQPRGPSLPWGRSSAVPVWSRCGPGQDDARCHMRQNSGLEPLAPVNKFLTTHRSREAQRSARPFDTRAHA